MCHPAALIIAATAVAAAGKGVSAMQAASMSRYEAKIADRNAALEREAGRNAADNGRIEAQRQYRKLSAVQGQQGAAMAANGIDQSFGSALQVQSDTAAMGAEDVGSIYRGTAQEVRGFDINASNFKAKAKAARKEGSNAMVRGAFDVASTVLSGASQYSKMKAGS